MNKYVACAILVTAVPVGIVVSILGGSPLIAGAITGLLYFCFGEDIQKYLKTKF